AAAAMQAVVAFAADETIVGAAAVEGVVAGIAVKPIGPAGAGDRVVARAAANRVLGVVPDKCIVAVTAEQTRSRHARADRDIGVALAGVDDDAVNVGVRERK